MRIKHVTLVDSGGAYLASRRISDSQQSIGIDSQLVVSRTSSREFSFVERIAFKADRTLTKKAKINSDFSIFKSLPYRPIDNFAGDLVNLHWVPGILPFDINLGLKAKYVVTLHDMNLFTGGCHHSYTCDKFSKICSKCPNVSGIVSKSLILHSHKRKLHQTTGIACAVAPSIWMKQKAESSAMFLNKEVIHIPNPVAPNFFLSTDRVARETRGAIQILILGSNYINKNSQKVLEVVNNIHSSITENIILLVIGDKHIATPVKQINLPSSSSEHEIAKFMSESDFMIYASPADNFPSLLLEAQALGIPVIALDNGGVGETFVDKKSGILVKSGWSGLFQASKSLIADQPKLRTYSIESRRFATNFTYEVIGKKYLNLYEQVLVDRYEC